MIFLNRFGLAISDPFSSCELGGVWARDNNIQLFGYRISCDIFCLEVLFLLISVRYLQLI